MTITECAKVLDLTPRQIAHAVEKLGAPTVRRGGKGRGKSTLVDIEALSRWLADRGTFTSLYRRRQADSLTRSLAQSTVAAFKGASGPHKLALGAGYLNMFVETDSAMRAQLGLPALRMDEWPPDVQQIHKVVSIFG